MILRLCFVIVLLVLGGASALSSGHQNKGADPLPSAWSLASGDGSVGSGSHGWTVMQSESVSPWMLVHIPPRRLLEDEGAQAKAALTQGTAAAGVGRFAATIESLPVALAASRQSVFMVFGTDTPGSGSARRVFGVRVERDPFAGLWRTLPTGRFEQLPSLPGEGELLAFVGMDDGPLAILKDAAGSVSAVRLEETRWRSIAIPAEVSTALAGGMIAATASPDSLIVIFEDSRGMASWQGVDLQEKKTNVQQDSRLDSSTLQDTPDAVREFRWTLQRYDAPPVPAAGRRAFVQGKTLWMAGWSAERGLALASADEQGRWALRREMSEVPARNGMIPMLSVDRLVIVWAELDAKNRDERRALEVDLSDLSTVYSGPLRMSGPVSRADYRLVILLMLVVTVSTLVFILKPEDRVAFSLPVGFSLAPPWRRVLAAAIDASISILVAEGGLQLAADYLPVVQSTSGWLLDVMLGSVLSSMVVGAITETTLGRTIGKMMTGLEVISIRRRGPGEVVASIPGVGPSFIRNLVKWSAFPLSLLGLMEGSGRGRAEELTGTAVVSRVVEESEWDERD